MSMRMTKNVNKRKVNPLGRCADGGIESYDKRCNRGKNSIIPKVRVDWIIPHVDAYSAGKRQKSGSHSPPRHVKQRLAPAG